jgi:hypothetical protein
LCDVCPVYDAICIADKAYMHGPSTFKITNSS